MDIVVIVLLVLGVIVLVLKGKPLYQFFVDLLTIDGMIGFLVMLLVIVAFFLFAVP